MRINETTFDNVNSSSSSLSMENPFDLDLKITELQVGHQGKESMVVTATAGYCDYTGTGKSMCCR